MNRSFSLLENGININQHVDICKGYFFNIKVLRCYWVLKNGRFLTYGSKDKYAKLSYLTKRDNGMRSSEKRYQIFVSSTYIDLIDERLAVLQAVASLRHIAVGMEFFAAATVPPWDYIKDAIDDCDYYVLILGGRYGSLSTDGVSFTEKEYDYAVSKAKPIIALLHQRPDNLPRNRTDGNDSAWEKLQGFRSKVADSCTCSFWKTSDELRANALTGLISEFERTPARGWVRPAPQPTAQLSHRELHVLPPIRDMSEILRRTLSRFDDEEAPVMPTGIPHLDEVVGGLRAGTLFLSASRPSMGLTTFAVNVIASAARLSLPVLTFIPSDTPEKFTGRVLSCLAQVELGRDFSELTEHALHAVTNAVKTLDNAHVRIDDSRSHTFETFALRCKEEKTLCGVLPLVVIDSVDFFNFFAENTNAGTALKSLALELDTCIMVTAHLGRALEARPSKRPVMADLGQAQTIGDKADVVLFLFRPEMYGLPPPREGNLEIIVAKNKLGPAATLRMCCFFSTAQIIPTPVTEETMGNNDF
jgi:hypothetical protein